MQEKYIINPNHQAELEILLKTELSNLPFSLREFLTKQSNGSISGDVLADIMLLWIERKNELIKTYEITEPEAQRAIYYQSISVTDLPREFKQYASEHSWSSHADLEKLIIQWIIATRNNSSTTSLSHLFENRRFVEFKPDNRQSS